MARGHHVLHQWKRATSFRAAKTPLYVRSR